MIKDYFNGKEPNRGINPDEAVAYGAAVQGVVLGGDTDSNIDEFVVIDVTPLTLGIDTVGNVMAKIIPRGPQFQRRSPKSFQRTKIIKRPSPPSV